MTPSFIDRARALLSDRAGQQPELLTSVVQHAPIDEYVFDDLLTTGERFRAEMTERPTVRSGDGGERVMENAPDLFADLFHSVHNANAQVALEDSFDVRADHQRHRDIMEALVDEEDFRVAKARAKGKGLLSAMTAMAMKEQLDLDDARSADDEDLRGQIERLERLQGEHDAQPEGTPVPPELADARRMVEAGVERIDNATDPVPVAERMAEEGKAVSDVWTGLSGTGDGDNARMDPGKALRLAQRWRDSDSMRRISLLVGVYERSMKASRRKDVRHGREQRIGVTTGNDLALTLSSEFVKLKRPGTRRLFLKRFADRELLQYDTQGVERGALGPQIIVLDNSGSMSADCGGVKRFEGAAAVALALMALAHRDGRPTYIIVVRRTVVGEYEFSGRTIDLEAMTDFAARTPDGGTDLTQALVRAEALLSHHEYRKADIVMLTDGADHLGQEDRDLRERFTARGVQLHGVTIGRPDSEYTNVMCDTTTYVTDLSGPSAATDHLAVATASN